jgi:hypothetical protein
MMKPVPPMTCGVQKKTSTIAAESVAGITPGSPVLEKGREDESEME